MYVDQHAPHTLDPESLDEADSAHIGSELVDLRGPFARAPAVLQVRQVQAETFNAGVIVSLMPLREGFWRRKISQEIQEELRVGV